MMTHQISENENSSQTYWHALPSQTSIKSTHSAYPAISTSFEEERLKSFVLSHERRKWKTGAAKNTTLFNKERKDKKEREAYQQWTKDIIGGEPCFLITIALNPPIGLQGMTNALESGLKKIHKIISMYEKCAIGTASFRKLKYEALRCKGIVVAENVKTNLHFHGILICPMHEYDFRIRLELMNLSRKCNMRSVTVDVKRIYDIEGAFKYCMKKIPNVNETNCIHYRSNIRTYTK